MSEARRPIVEDEPQIRRFVRDALEREGYGVVEAATAAQGLAAAAAQKPRPDGARPRPARHDGVDVHPRPARLVRACRS